MRTDAERKLNYQFRVRSVSTPSTEHMILREDTGRCTRNVWEIHEVRSVHTVQYTALCRACRGSCLLAGAGAGAREEVGVWRLRPPRRALLSRTGFWVLTICPDTATCRPPAYILFFSPFLRASFLPYPAALHCRPPNCPVELHAPCPLPFQRSCQVAADALEIRVSVPELNVEVHY
jgi:hypothetical protein